MNKAHKYNIYIGLLKSDMKTTLNKKNVLNKVSTEFKKIGVIGFNADVKPYCYWNGEPEPALKISFINTFNVYEKDIIKVLETLKDVLEQETILIESEPILYNFV